LYHKKTTLLSFDLGDEEEEGEAVSLKTIVEAPKLPEQKNDKKRAGYGKDQTVNTTFLPDIGRDNFIRELKKQYTGTSLSTISR
jgi:hypothetical protein